MSSDLELLKSTLRQGGLSLTKPRIIVFQALHSSEALTMQSLLAVCSPGIDRASVYRVIAVFEELGIVIRVQSGWKYRLELSDVFQHHHHHFNCLHCGQVTSIAEDPNLEHRIRQLASEANFLMTDHQMEIRGFCTNCRSYAEFKNR